MTEPTTGITKLGPHTILPMQESITQENSAEIEARLQGVIEKSACTIILDFKETGFLDSAALEMLLRMQQAVTERGCRMKIVGLNAVCRDILISTRLINQFQVYPGLQEAVRETP